MRLEYIQQLLNLASAVFLYLKQFWQPIARMMVYKGTVDESFNNFFLSPIVANNLVFTKACFHLKHASKLNNNNKESIII